MGFPRKMAGCAGWLPVCGEYRCVLMGGQEEDELGLAEHLTLSSGKKWLNEAPGRMAAAATP